MMDFDMNEYLNLHIIKALQWTQIVKFSSKNYSSIAGRVNYLQKETIIRQFYDLISCAFEMGSNKKSNWQL